MKSKHKTFTLETKYNQEASEKGFIKITPHSTDEIVFTADEMLDLIAQDVRKKDIALALSSTDVEHILMTEIERTFHFTADKDYKAGDKTSFNVKQTYPVVLAALEAVYNMCKMGDAPWVIVDKEMYKEAVDNLSKENTDFVKKIWRLEGKKE